MMIQIKSAKESARPTLSVREDWVPL